MSLHHMLRAAAGYQAPAPATTDPQFNYVSLLLHGDGTNGAQNNTFIDSSTNNFTITRNGNATQGSLSPYGSLWSNFFDGASDYLTFDASSSAAFGTGAFTVEGWFYLANTTGSKSILDCRPTQTAVPWGFEFQGGAPSWYNGSSNTSSTSVTANTWNHVAVVREGTGTNQTKIYVNGVVGLTYTDATNYGTMNTAARIGGGLSNVNWFFGNISNLRIVKGTAVYTSAFTPPTAPLTAITNTSLLTCQSNLFRDASANNFTITRNGDVRVTKDSPFLPTAAYSTSTIGGSGYFDGSTDWLEIPNNTALQLGASDFCVECWIYPTALPAGGNVARFISKNSGYTSLFEYTLMIRDDGSIQADAYTTGYFSIQSAAGLVKANSSWYHVAYSKAGTTASLFVNGVRVATGTLSGTIQATTAPLAIGRDLETSGRELTGYISNVRIVKGSSVYTPSSSSLTVPTAPLTAITNTSLLVNFTNAGIIDNAAENDMETVGNAQISTSVKKYGTGSLAFDGTGDWLLVPDNTNLQLGSGAFTVEGWVNLALLGSARGLASKGTSTTGWSLSVNSLNQVIFTDATTAITTTTALMANTWYHVAVVRVGTSTNQTVIYINGVSSATGTSASNFTQTNPMYIGADRTGGSALNGYIDDLRITKGFARYTAAFTPPTAAFPDQ